MHATCTTYLNLLNLITRILFGVEHKLLAFSLFSFLQSPGTSSFLGTRLPHHPLLEHPLQIFFPLYEGPCFTHIYNGERSLCFDLHDLDSKREDRSLWYER
jgi:hypothetical protein